MRCLWCVDDVLTSDSVKEGHELSSISHFIESRKERKHSGVRAFFFSFSPRSSCCSRARLHHGRGRGEKEVKSMKNGRGTVFVVVPLRSLPSFGTKTKRNLLLRLVLSAHSFARFHSRDEAFSTQSMHPSVEGAPSWERKREKTEEREMGCIVVVVVVALASHHQNSFLPSLFSPFLL